ncbi:hypothetical protein [Actinomycetospora callitridis]|uniref:hypothetical protein n=1 Tax=Actinomycetospora callitridis TaxID=913944 RepID=UPI0023652A76|nr:hypothetical protein [Actinomycetospora callitridis]MDD7917711.1 hypothetical protein [Actinomycetospora callitridis]
MTPAAVPGPVPAPAHRFVPQDAPPAGLGYPAPTSYRPHPVTGVPTPPHGAVAARTVGAVRTAPRTARPGTRAPLAVAVAGAAIALIGIGSQLPSLVDAVATTTASAPSPASAPVSPTVAHQCATIVADALDDTVTSLGQTPSDGWAGVVDARGDALAATYGATSPEHDAFVAGSDDILGWLRDGSTEDYGTVTTRVAQTVATTCGS